MASELTAELLAQPAPHAARVLAMHRLDELSAAYDVFLADEAKGLHDVRVAVRRLRSWLRAYESEIGNTLRKKTKRRLRKLAKASNPARDAEVAVEWIAAQTPCRATRARRPPLHDTALRDGSADASAYGARHSQAQDASHPSRRSRRSCKTLLDEARRQRHEARRDDGGSDV